MLMMEMVMTLKHVFLFMISLCTYFLSCNSYIFISPLHRHLSFINIMIINPWINSTANIFPFQFMHDSTFSIRASLQRTPIFRW